MPAPRSDVHGHRPDPDPAAQVDDAEAGRPEGQNRERDVGGVGDRDDQDGTDVVHDRQGEEQDLQRKGDTRAEQGQEPDHERNVGGHRDAPASPPGPAAFHRQVDGGGHDHPPEGRRDRQRRLPGVLEFAEGDFALDLQADDEKEDGHQPVVDPEQERLVQLEAPECEADPRLPDFGERGGPRRIGEDEGEHRAGEQHDAAGRLDVQEADGGLQQGFDQGAPGFPLRSRGVVGIRQPFGDLHRVALRRVTAHSVGRTCPPRLVRAEIRSARAAIRPADSSERQGPPA